MFGANLIEQQNKKSKIFFIVLGLIVFAFLMLKLFQDGSKYKNPFEKKKVSNQNLLNNTIEGVKISAKNISIQIEEVLKNFKDLRIEIKGIHNETNKKILEKEDKIEEELKNLISILK